jgi:homoaconitase/3-isopropylmalate dehydratase large subunit
MVLTHIMQPKPKKMRINVNGTLSKGVGPKDVALYIISNFLHLAERAILLNMRVMYLKKCLWKVA